MDILIVTPILYDVSSPFNHLFKDIIKGFLDGGHNVVRIAAVETDSDEGFKLGVAHENIKYIKVKRKRKNKANIIARCISDSITNIRMAVKILRHNNADVLFEDVSYSSFWSVAAARIKKLRVVAMLQDVWPDNAVQSGLIRENSLIYRYFEMRQQYVYKKADKLICISDDMKSFIASKKISENKINVIYNWGYTDEIARIPWEENDFVKKYDLSPGIFYAVYAGNIGRMQNVELIVGAAELLKTRTDIRFMIIGDGVRKEYIADMIKAKKLDNIIQLPMQPQTMAVSIYSAAGANIIPLVPGGIKTAMPSKTGICLSCGRPIIFCFGGDCKFAHITAEYDAGICVNSGGAEELAGAVTRLAARENTEADGAYELFKAVFVKKNNVKKYVEAIGSE